MSSDGSIVIVGRDTDGVYLSTNSGSTYSKVSTSVIPNGSYYVSISSDGTKMMAADVASTKVFVSTDTGTSWTMKTTNGSSFANRTCMAGNGSRWIVLANLGVYSSTDNGGTWSAISALGVGAWTSCAMSEDGSKIFVLKFGSALKYSTDSGANWSTSGNSYTTANVIAATPDGSKLVLTDRDAKNVYTSTNFGASFTLKYYAAAALYGVGISSDGSRIAVAVATGRLVASIDGGETWGLEMTPPSLSWGAIAMNAAGSKVIASPAGGTGLSYQGIIPTPASLALQSISPNASPLVYRSTYTLSVLANTAGKVTFYANGKKITKCSQVSTVSLAATCSFAPSSHGVIVLSALLSPTDSTYFASKSTLLQTSAIARSSKR